LNGWFVDEGCKKRCGISDECVSALDGTDRASFFWREKMAEEIEGGGLSVCECACASGTADGIEQLLARDVMQCGVASIDRKQPVQKAIRLLIERDITGLAVTHKGHLEGMLSEKDLLGLLHETRYFPGLVEDYWTCGVMSFNVETKLAVIRNHLIGNPFRHAPILYRGRIAGMITRADLIRVYKERFRPQTEASNATSRDKLLAEDAMRYGLMAVGPDMPLYDAMDRMARHRVNGLPVVGERLRLLGIITVKDLLDCIDKPEAIGASVGAFMTRNVVTFDRKASLRRVCECLIENDFHQVPILDGNRLVGIIGRSDILRYRASALKR
jgi:CBS domain-containing protein